jgi:hypothetical protein
MKQLIKEAKRFQQLAGIINETENIEEGREALNKALENLEVGDVFRVVNDRVGGVMENTNYEITMLSTYLLDFKKVKNPEHAALGQLGTMSVDRFKENVLSGDIIIYPK